MSIEAMKLALEALELHGQQYPHMVKGYCIDAITALRAAIEQAEKQEPVAYWHRDPNLNPEEYDGMLYFPDDCEGHCANCIPLYTAPPQREWVGLTDEEISEVLGSDIHLEHSGELRFIRSIEAKLKEKNT